MSVVLLPVVLAVLECEHDAEASSQHDGEQRARHAIAPTRRANEPPSTPPIASIGLRSFARFMFEPSFRRVPA